MSPDVASSAVVTPEKDNGSDSDSSLSISTPSEAPASPAPLPSIICVQFTAWATYTNGQLLGVDATLTKDYFSTLKRFSEMCVAEVRKGDYEERNR